VTITCIMSVCLEWLGSQLAFSWNFGGKICWENSSFIKVRQKYLYFTWRPIYVFHHILLIAPWKGKCFRQKCKENQNTNL